MVTKTLNGIVGYGFTDEETLDICKGTMLLYDIQKIHNHPELISLRKHLAPWFPTPTTLHINTVGYFTEKSIYGIRSLFDFCVNRLKNLTYLECMTVLPEIIKFLSCNEIKTDISGYTVIMPEFTLYKSNKIVQTVSLGSFTVIFYENNQLGMKRFDEEQFWICSYESKDDIRDKLLYISCVRGYTDIMKILK